MTSEEKLRALRERHRRLEATARAVVEDARKVGDGDTAQVCDLPDSPSDAGAGRRGSTQRLRNHERVMSEHNVMTPTHPAWDDFTSQLGRALDFKGEPDDLHWQCDGMDQVRETLRNFDVETEPTVSYFLDNGAHCSCEVLFNIAAPALQ
jgi:hypothetical protein